MLAVLTSRLGLASIAIALVLGIIGVQTLRLAHAKKDLTVARTDLATAKTALTASEALRKTEYAKATSALSEAEKACSARVQAALSTGAKIHVIVSKPVKLDANKCPVRALVPVGELRDALDAGRTP